MVWARIPSLNLVYYGEDLLWALASAIGNLVKVYLHTLKMERGRLLVCVLRLTSTSQWLEEWVYLENGTECNTEAFILFVLSVGVMDTTRKTALLLW